MWNKKNQNTQNNENVKVILTKKDNLQKELNPNIKFDLSNIKYKNYINDLKNNFGSSDYRGSLSKINDYKFSKFKDVEKLNFKPLFLNNGLIFFDKTGSIIRYDFNEKIIWKKNYYKKSEKKISPKLNFAIKGNNLIVADNIAKIYSIDITSGDLLWSTFNNYPLNSEIKIYKDNFFVVDYKNTLRCFKIIDGSECWNVPTENSLTISGAKYSIIISNDLVIFNNSIGDITAVNISTGLINWQLPTQSSNIINESYSFINSQLVADENSIYFSNNRNEFFSINARNGVINWKQNINSNLIPTITEKFVFTVSNEGYLFVLDNQKGDVIRITNLLKNIENKKKLLKPSGFILARNKIYLSLNNGRLIKVDVNTGTQKSIFKLGNSKISRPKVFDKSMFLVKKNAIIKTN